MYILVVCSRPCGYVEKPSAPLYVVCNRSKLPYVTIFGGIRISGNVDNCVEK